MSHPRPPFEIGLVLAGAISAGAYTGGVIDFLLEALGEWERRRRDDPESVARHAVRLKVVAGTSAGGMTGGMLLGALANRAAPVRTDPGAGSSSGNPLFDSWVQAIDIEPLLGRQDLATYPDGFPRSLLDASPLDEIARQALRMPATVTPPAFLSDPFHLQFTVTNLRGVPYRMGVGNARFAHDMLLHGDLVQFAFGQSFPPGTADDIPYRLPWNELATPARQGALDLLCRAALATGAFPVGLAPRMLNHRFDSGAKDLYSRRRWRIRRSFSATQPPSGEAPWQDLDPALRRTLGEKPAQWSRLESLDCQWPVPRPDDYRFLCVDGGVINNEPLELARRVLTDGASFIASDGIATDKAMILIDPFPGGEQFATGEYAPEQDLLHVLPALFGAMIHQLRFKPDELLAAMQDDYFSRFVIAPSRQGENQSEINGEKAIACGALGGFSGFLARDFRVHDYFLGRLNCRNFLLNHFVLPRDNPLFAADYRSQYQGREIPKGNHSCLPIIPLYGTAAAEETLKPWPRMDDDRLRDIARWLDQRYQAVSDRTIDELLGSSMFSRILARLVRNLNRQKMNDWMMRSVDGGLRRHKLR